MKKILIEIENDAQKERIDAFLAENALALSSDWNAEANIAAQVQKKERQMRLLAVVSLAIMLILGAIAFWQVSETEKARAKVEEMAENARLHKQIAENLQDSLIAREMRYRESKAVAVPDSMAFIQKDTVKTTK
ncbi:hypothetical protein [Hugenholtzia roseola]|uniref:hypothetical protein n=1 Tax=Hugenholtzia roseola TaxID=1002 RepID=UPI00047C0A6B|nr:hypothetical protein [Hugenholtzia roseola]